MREPWRVILSNNLFSFHRSCVPLNPKPYNRNRLRLRDMQLRRGGLDFLLGKQDVGMLEDLGTYALDGFIDGPVRHTSHPANVSPLLETCDGRPSRCEWRRR